MKKIIILLGLLVLAIFVVSCVPKEAEEKGALAGDAKMLPPISKPTCSYLIGFAGSFKLTKELGLDGIFGNPSLFADQFKENELTSGCLGVYNLRSCNTLDYINEEGVPASGSPYWNMNWVAVAIVKLPARITETNISAMMKSGNLVWQKEEFMIKPVNLGGKIKNVWRANGHLLWVSGDLLIDIVGPLAEVDWSLFDTYYQKYPATN